MEDLAPTARELLEAARRLLKTRHYSSLTLKAIGREAGQSESLIGYHFGSKTGLLVALVDWLLYDILKGLQDCVTSLQEGEERIDKAIDDSRRLTADMDAYQAFYNLLPHLVETREGRLRMAELYRRYRAMNARALASTSDRASSASGRTVGSMHVALTDGLAIQILVDPGSVDLQLVAGLWKSFILWTSAGRDAGASTPAVPGENLGPA